MSDQGAEGTQTAAPEATQTAGLTQADLDAAISPVLERISELGGQQDDYSQYQDQGYGYDPYGAQPQEPGYQYGQPEPQYDQFGNPTGPITQGLQQQYAQQQQGYQQPGPDMGQQAAMQQLQGLIGQAMQQHLGPINQRFEQMDQQALEQQLDKQAQELEQKYPEFAEKGDEIESKAFEAAQAMAERIVQAIGAGLPQQQRQAAVEDLAKQMALQPDYLEQYYLASKARGSAEQETPASTSQEFQLEAGGGAAQPGQEQGSEGSQWLGQAGDRPRRSLSDLGI